MKYIFLACLLMLAAPAHAESTADSGISLEDLRAFTDAWGYVRDHYVDDIDDRQLLEAAMRGMLEALDPHSKWLSQEELRNLEEQAVGRYGGLGIQVGSFEDHLRVVSVFERGPAAEAGLRAGDRIIAIDNTELDRENVSDAPRMLRGEAGSEVSLQIRREGESEPLQVSVTREVIQRDSVSMESVGPRLQHIRIHRFQQSTATEIDALLDHLEDSDDAPAGLILDLRDNPGGMLQVAIAVADRFLSDRLVVTAEGRGLRESTEYHTGPDERLVGVPMVVLVDRGSASASEILAAALRDHGRAMIVGEATYGKGSVQTIWGSMSASSVPMPLAFT
jgi:carboxyl-terminal processing protease